MRLIGPRGGICGVCLVALGLAGAADAAQPTMFEEGVAQRAFTAIQDKVGRKLRVLTLTITAGEIRAEIANADKPGETQTWTVSHSGLAGALGVDFPVLQMSGRASLPGGGSIEESLIDIDAAGLAIVPKLASDAVARARFQQPGRATEMDLLRLPNIVGPAARDPYWSVHVEAPEEEADISAKLTGELTNVDLSHTKRFANLKLLAGGPDLDEIVQNIRKEMKDKWVFHYFQIEKKGIDFDVHLASVQNPQIMRFTATPSEIKTYNISMPHRTFPGQPADDPFALSDADFGVLNKLGAAAVDRLGIVDGAVQRIILSKPHRENGGALEWQVDVRNGHAPLIVMPGAPPVEEGSVTFDIKGNVLRVKYPPGKGPQTNLFDSLSLQKAIDKVAERLRPHVQVSEFAISDSSIKITARDPQDAKKFAVFTYQDEDVARAPEPLQMMANMMAEPGWLWDLAELKPSVVQSLAALEA
jgi:hypothetical protein